MSAKKFVQLLISVNQLSSNNKQENKNIFVGEVKVKLTELWVGHVVQNSELGSNLPPPPPSALASVLECARIFCDAPCTIHNTLFYPLWANAKCNTSAIEPQPFLISLPKSFPCVSPTCTKISRNGFVIFIMCREKNLRNTV